MAKYYEKIADTKSITKEEWLEFRKSGIGGSDAGAVVGLNPYTSAYSVYHEKLSLVEPFEGNEKTRLGTDLEDYVAKRFEERTGKRVRRLNAMLRSKENPFMLADVDRMIVGENAGLECKTTANHDGYKFDEGEYPAHWACQCIHYLAVTGAERWYLCVLDLSSGKIAVIAIERDENEIKALIQIEKRFWENNVILQVCPTPNGDERCDEIIAEKYPQAETSAPIIDLMAYGKELARLAEVKSTIKTLENEKSVIEQTIKECLGTSHTGEYGIYKITYKNSVSQRVDLKKLKAERHDIYAAYAVPQSVRKLLLTVKNK